MFGASAFGASAFGASASAPTPAEEPPVVPDGPVIPVVPSRPDPRDYVYTPGYDLPVPSSFDLLEYAGSIEDQMTTNSCAANAVVSALEILLSRSKSFKDLSRLYLYWYLRRGTDLAGGDNGAYLRDGFKTANRQGLCGESTWPFIPAAVNSEPSAAADNEAATLKAYKYQSIICGRSDTTTLIKTAIACGYPVVLGMRVGDSFQSIAGATLYDTAAQYKPTTRTEVTSGHAVTAIGYTSDGMLLIENSWGTSWGAGGYAYVPMDIFLTDVFEAWTCTGLNGVTIPPLLARPTWDADVTFPRPRIEAYATNDPQDNTALLKMTSWPRVSMLGGANAYPILPQTALTITGRLSVLGGIAAALPAPTLNITGKAAILGHADLTFGYSGGENFAVRVEFGAEVELASPQPVVAARSTTGSVGAAELSSEGAAVAGYSGAVLNISPPSFVINATAVLGNIAKLQCALPTTSATCKTGALGSGKVTTAKASVLGLSGGVGRAASPACTITASTISGALGRGKVVLTTPTTLGFGGGVARLASPVYNVTTGTVSGALGRGRVVITTPTTLGFGGGSAGPIQIECSAIASSRTGAKGAINMRSSRPSAVGYAGGHFRGVMS